MSAKTRAHGAAAATAIDPALQAQVDAQLMEQGAFAPLDYLMDSGRLLYADYESWRRREIDSLDDVLMGDRDRTLAEISQAASYARGIGLVEQTQEFHSWSADHTSLRASADPQVHRALAARYAPAQSAPQMDLFFDNPVVALANGIARALAARDSGAAQQQLDRLYAQAPNHADLASFDRLSAALSHLQEPLADPAAEIDFLLDIMPDAKRLLGSDARDLLSPLWQRVGAALAGRTFSPDQPDLHRSFALAQAQDWVAVSECVMSEPRWFDHPILCLRLAQSSFHRRRRTEALMAWFHVCWRAPKQAAEALDSRRQADSEIAGLWQRFLDLEDNASNADSSSDSSDAPPPLTAADFPAWMLLREPSLTRNLAENLSTASTPGEEHYRCVHRWVRAREAGDTQQEIALRKVLQTAQPALLGYLKRVVGAEGR
jgi:hypothetical protein